MTLGELKEMIEDLERVYHGDIDVLGLDVYAEYDYGDHCHTKALTDFSDMDVTRPIKTVYSESGLALRDGNDSEEDQIVALTKYKLFE